MCSYELDDNDKIEILTSDVQMVVDLFVRNICSSHAADRERKATNGLRWHG